MPKVLVSDQLAPEGLEILEGARGIEVIYEPDLDPPSLLEVIRDAEGLLVRSGTQVTAEVLEAAVIAVPDETWGERPKAFVIRKPDSSVSEVDLIEHVKSALYLGLHRVRGIRCHHLAFSQDNIDWQIWIEDGHQPVPRKFVITYKKVKSHPQLTGEIYDWNFAPHLSDSLFNFLAPPNATRTEFSSVSQ